MRKLPRRRWRRKGKKNALLLPLIVNVKMTELLRRTPAWNVASQDVFLLSSFKFFIHINFSRIFLSSDSSATTVDTRKITSTHIKWHKKWHSRKKFLSSLLSHVRHNKLHFNMATQCQLHLWNSKFSSIRFDLFSSSLLRYNFFSRKV